MKKTIFNVSALSALFIPAMAFAQNFTYVNGWITELLVILRYAITVITILMTVFFLYNVLRFIMNKDATKSADYRKSMINGLIGLFIAAAVWGIIGLAGSITGTGSAGGSANVTCPPGMTYKSQDGICEN